MKDWKIIVLQPYISSPVHPVHIILHSLKLTLIENVWELSICWETNCHVEKSQQKSKDHHKTFRNRFESKKLITNTLIAERSSSSAGPWEQILHNMMKTHLENVKTFNFVFPWGRLLWCSTISFPLVVGFTAADLSS